MVRGFPVLISSLALPVSRPGLLGLVGVVPGAPGHCELAAVGAGFTGVDDEGPHDDRHRELVLDRLSSALSRRVVASRRRLPVPEAVLPSLLDHAYGRPESAHLFESPRKPGHPVGKRYVSDVVTRGVTRANTSRAEKIARINVHGLRHTFAAIALSEAGGDILSVSRALGHSKPSTTLNEYGHLAPAGLEPLMARIDGLVAGKGTSA